MEGDIGVCGIAVIGQFFMRYFGNFNFKLRYCGVLQNLRDEVFLAFCSTIFDKKETVLHGFRPFSGLSGF